MKLESGKTYSLSADTSRIKKVFCDYNNISIYNISTYEMDGNNPKGEIKITKLDEEKRIVAGTFWFDAVGITGHKIQIRKKRFDLKY